MTENVGSLVRCARDFLFIYDKEELVAWRKKF